MSSSLSSTKLCKYFLRGNCRNADQCKYLHQQSTIKNNNNIIITIDDKKEEDSDQLLDDEEQQTTPLHSSSSTSQITEMEIVRQGIHVTIDFSKLPSSSSEDFLNQLFKFPSSLSSSETEKPHFILALDYHRVTDNFVSTKDEIYPQQVGPICVVSYVRQNGRSHARFRKSLIERIENKQIQMGILVFKKVHEPLKRQVSDSSIEFVASKRHAVELVMNANKGLTKTDKVLFVDDTRDNVETVDTLRRLNEGILEGKVKSALFTEKSAEKLKEFLVEQSRELLA